MKADYFQRMVELRFIAEAVEELRSGMRRRNKGIDGPTGPNHCCAVRFVGEAMLLREPREIVLQQPQPGADIGMPLDGSHPLHRKAVSLSAGQVLK